MIGRTLSHYKILSEINRGGMGIVYRAVDLKLDREVAVPSIYSSAGRALDPSPVAQQHPV